MADNQTQERDQDVVTYSAFAGLRNDVTPERFSAADLAVGDNVDIDKSGRLTRRQGYTLQRAGAAHSLWADEMQDICLYAAGSGLYQLAKDYSARQIATLQGVGAKLSYERVSDRVYFSNGVDTGIFERGIVRSWGLPVPPQPGVATTVGQMPAGTYQFALTYLRNDLQESGASRAGMVTVAAGGGLTFALPASTDPTVTRKVLYLSTANGETLFAAATLDNLTASFTYRNDTRELNLPLTTQFLQPAPAGQLVSYYRGRAFVAVDDTLYASSEFGYELFDMREYLQLDGRITLLAPMTDKERSDSAQASGFFIGTDRSCGVLVGSGPQDFQYVPKVPYGAILGTVDYVDGSMFQDGSAGARQLPMWLTTSGLCVGMPDMAIRNLTRSRYLLPAAGQGAALFMPGPNRFIAIHDL